MRARTREALALNRIGAVIDDWQAGVYPRSAIAVLGQMEGLLQSFLSQEAVLGAAVFRRPSFFHQRDIKSPLAFSRHPAQAVMAAPPHLG